MLKDLCDRALAVAAAALPEAEAGPAWPGAVRQYPLDRPAVSVTLSAAEAAGYDALSGGDATGGSRWQAELLFELDTTIEYGVHIASLIDQVRKTEGSHDSGDSDQ